MAATKPSTVTDVALRLLFADLLGRKQARPGDLGRLLGYRDSTELSKFLKGNINFSRKKLTATIETLAITYNANQTFLETGHGEMYAGGKPYMAHEPTESFEMSDSNNIATYYARNRIKELEETIKKLREKIEQQDLLLKAKDETIELQKKIIEVSGFPGTRG